MPIIPKPWRQRSQNLRILRSFPSKRWWLLPEGHLILRMVTLHSGSDQNTEWKIYSNTGILQKMEKFAGSHDAMALGSI